MIPGNFATNIAAGSKYGYLLLLGILISKSHGFASSSPYSAKLGIATGKTLPEIRT
ncbi:divalent metal cation transporter [Bacillus pumilus]|nr:divalent metal cation transporter [Bacillus pumilus]